MKYAKYCQRAWSAGLLALIFAVALPAGAAQIDVPLNGLNGGLTYDSSGGLSASGISGSGNLLFSGLDFSVPDVSSTTFNAILGGSSPVLATLTLNGSAGNVNGTVTISDTFANPADMALFFTPAADESTVLQFASGTISGAFNANLSNIFINAADRGFGGSSGSGPDQLTSGSANIVATTDNFYGNMTSGEYTFVGSGTLSLQQVAVPEPGHIALLGLALLGIGLIWRRKGHGSRA